MLENGSGEVFTAARVVILVACAVAASVPPSRAATQPTVAPSAPRQRRPAPRLPECG
jgi:hypothetical protein